MSRLIVELSRNHMATTFILKVSCEKSRARAAESVLNEAHECIARIEAEVSEFRDDSELSKLNALSAGIEFRPETRSMRDLIQLSFRFYSETQGAFDPSFKSEVGIGLLDRFEYSAHTGPKTDGKHAGPKTDVIMKKAPRVRLGFGAIGKGYALDRVRTLLEREGFQDFLLSAGGSSLIISGTPCAYMDWPLAWSWEKRGNDYFGRQLNLKTKRDAVAIGVSGTMEQGEHVQRESSQSKLLSSFIAGVSAAQTDAYSTAVLSQGWERSGEWLSRLNEPHAVAGIFDEDRVLVWNGVFQNNFGSLE